MVKIEEGYVMNAREKAEFDRVNALPRKMSGRVDFYYNRKPDNRRVSICSCTPKRGATVTAGRWGFFMPRHFCPARGTGRKYNTTFLTPACAIYQHHD